MIFDIHSDSAVPIFEQITAQLIYGIASGALEPGTMIPSVRELAEQLLVHPNTVARAFQELDRRRIVVARRGRGMEVTKEGPGRCRKQRKEILRERIRDLLREASLALPPDEMRQLLEQEFTRHNGKRISRPSKRLEQEDGRATEKKKTVGS